MTFVGEVSAVAQPQYPSPPITKTLMLLFMKPLIMTFAVAQFIRFGAMDA